MIRQLARWYQEERRQEEVAKGGAVPPDSVLLQKATRWPFKLHPMVHLHFLEEAWAYRDRRDDRPDLAIPERLLYGWVPGLESGIRDQLSLVASDIYDPIKINRPKVPDTGSPAKWDHLIYAYL